MWRYDLNANQIFNWLKDPKFVPDAQTVEDEAKFLPVEMISEPIRPEIILDAGGLIELELASGHYLRISGS